MKTETNFTVIGQRLSSTRAPLTRAAADSLSLSLSLSHAAAGEEQLPRKRRLTDVLRDRAGTVSGADACPASWLRRRRVGGWGGRKGETMTRRGTAAS